QDPIIANWLMLERPEKPWQDKSRTQRRVTVHTISTLHPFLEKRHKLDAKVYRFATVDQMYDVFAPDFLKKLVEQLGETINMACVELNREASFTSLLQDLVHITAKGAVPRPGAYRIWSPVCRRHLKGPDARAF